MEKSSDDNEQSNDDKVSSDEKTPSTSANTSGSNNDDNDELGMEKLRKYLSQKLRLSSNDDDDGDCDEEATKTTKTRILSELNLDGIVNYINEKGCKKIITMAGAGISTAAGIPDFRSPSSGLYHNLAKYNLPHPQAIFELDFFKENPEPFFVLAKQLLPEGFKPTISHYFIRLLWEKGLLLRHYTQNVDTLERVAGLPKEKLVEAHGTFHTGKCLACRAPYDLPWMKKKIAEGIIPKCEECLEGIVKPDIVFFGEMLPERFHTLIEHDFPQADLLIIMGSSLVVQPFASLIERVNPTCPRLLINKEKVGMQDRLLRLIGLRQGFDFDPKHPESGRDVPMITDCDTGCQMLAEKLGWSDELNTLVQNEHERLDAEKT